MRFHLVLVMCLALAGCSQKMEGFAPVAEKAAANTPNRTMAYEHAVELVVDEPKLQSVYQAALAACQSASAEQCVVLNSSLRSGEYASAHLKFRARPAGIQALRAVLASKGELINQSTTAEDLAAPLQDAAKQLDMLQNYRGQLEQLRGRAGGDIDALMKVTRELAEVQSNIEALSGKKAHMLQRVDTEILTVDIGTGQRSSFWKPVSSALSGASGNLSQGVSTVISGCAFLLPWALLLWALVWGIRALWRRSRRKEHAKARQST